MLATRTATYLDGVATGLRLMFLAALAACVAAPIAALFIKEVPLRGAVQSNSTIVELFAALST
ncbi:hypothetical protein [Actinoplanes sp. TFC3]|uniref:hypothetical protein n=1 Tax=Actinoplanes sp. TFC3 TaxID=1710355 RepID=UPI000830BA93|nr:hypothetical protein [Actinoplanes sp. TFC3]